MYVMPDESGGLLGFTMLDLVIILIIFIGVYIGYRRGFIYSLFKLINIIGSLFISTIIYPIFSRFLIGTSFYSSLTNNIISQLGISNAIEDVAATQQENIVNNLPIPRLLANSINENINIQNNNLIDINSIEQHIGNFLATIIINIISFIVVLLIASVGIKLLLSSLNIITKLPIISSFNNILGAVTGLVWSLFFIWIGLIIYPLFFVRGETNLGIDILYSSSIALFLYERNPLVLMILGIFS